MHFHDEAEHHQVPFRFEGAPGRGRRIVITAAKRGWLAEHRTRPWRRPPTDSELARLVEDFVPRRGAASGGPRPQLDRADLGMAKRLRELRELLGRLSTSEWRPND